jgi:hypothetical protein
MDFLEKKEWIIIISKITSMEKETWGNVNVKVPYRQTTLDDEMRKLSKLKLKLDEIQSIYDIQSNFVKEIEAL